VVAVPHSKVYLYYILLIAVSLSAAERDPMELKEPAYLSANMLVMMVLQENPGIAELIAAAEAAAFSVDPAGSLDDPVFSYAFAPRTFGREGQGLNQKIELSQSIPWPGTLGAREQAARSSALAASESVDALRLRVAALARSAYAEWYFTHQALEIHDSTHVLLDELRSVAETRYAAGRALQQDVLQVELEQLNLHRHGLRLTQQKETARAQINALLNRLPDAQVPEPGAVSIPKSVAPLETLQNYALLVHPELRGLDVSHVAQVTVAEKALLPDLRFTAGYNSLWDEADKRPVIGISINVPFNRSKRKAEVSRAKAEVRRTQSRLANQRAQLLGELARAHAKVIESLSSRLSRHSYMKSRCYRLRMNSWMRHWQITGAERVIS
jgi:outer membrane protein TolC